MCKKQGILWNFPYSGLGDCILIFYVFLICCLWYFCEYHIHSLGFITLHMKRLMIREEGRRALIFDSSLCTHFSASFCPLSGLLRLLDPFHTWGLEKLINLSRHITVAWGVWSSYLDLATFKARSLSAIPHSLRLCPRLYIHGKWSARILGLLTPISIAPSPTWGLLVVCSYLIRNLGYCAIYMKNGDEQKDMVLFIIGGNFSP